MKIEHFIMGLMMIMIIGNSLFLSKRTAEIERLREDIIIEKKLILSIKDNMQQQIVPKNIKYCLIMMSTIKERNGSIPYEFWPQIDKKKMMQYQRRIDYYESKYDKHEVGPYRLWNFNNPSAKIRRLRGPG